MRLADGVARSLQAWGVEVVFGLLGDGNFPYLARYTEAGGRFVRVAHEATAVAMADGYSRASGETAGAVGVASVTHGPGFTNTLTALIESVKYGSEVLVVTSTTRSVRGLFQELDLRTVCHGAGVQFERVYSPQSAYRDLARAWRLVRGTRRPVVLDIPADLLDATVPDEPVTRLRTLATFSPPAPQPPDPDAVDDALGVLLSANRPIVLAGRGAVRAGAETVLTELAAASGARLATTLLAKELFRGCAGDLGIFGTLASETASGVFAAADCVVAFGASLNRYTSDSGALLGRGCRVVHVDVDPARIATYIPVDVAVVGDAAAVARAMVDRLQRAGVLGGGRSVMAGREPLPAHERRIDPFVDRGDADHVDLRTAMLALDRLLPAARNLVTDLGRFQRTAWKYVGVEDPRHFTHTANYGSMGLGLGVGLGMAVASPRRPTLAVLGDGGFMAAAQELSVAVRERLSLVVAVANDGAYGAEWDRLIQTGKSPDLARNDWPDVAVLARALGAEAYTVRSAADIDTLADRLGEVGSEGPVLLDLRLDPEVSIFSPPPR